MIAGRPGESSTAIRCDRPRGCIRYRQELLNARLREMFRIIRAAVTTQLFRVSSADDDVLTGRLRDRVRIIRAGCDDPVTSRVQC